MTLTIYALDSQFAASTGNNVNSGAGTSTFDYPPTSTQNLIIESLPGDATPYLFSPGDTYTLTFSGQGGDTISEATVIRSDYIDVGGDSGYAVVFEGLDSNGELTQVVWTPEFDLESWYWNNFDAGNSPGFYNSDTSSSTTYQAVCFEASMRVDTPDGPRPVCQLRPGDLVTTRHHGPQPLQFAVSRRVPGRGRHAPVVFAPGTRGNDRPLVLSQQHRLLQPVPDPAWAGGAPEVLIPAVAHVDGGAVRVAPRDWITYVHLLFEAHEIIRCEGVLCESLYLGQMATRVLGALGPPGGVDNVDSEAEPFRDIFAAGAGQMLARPALTVREGAALLDRLSDRPARAPAMLLSPGRKHARPYRLNPARSVGRVRDDRRPGLTAVATFEES